MREAGVAIFFFHVRRNGRAVNFPIAGNGPFISQHLINAEVAVQRGMVLTHNRDIGLVDNPAYLKQPLFGNGADGR